MACFDASRKRAHRVYIALFRITDSSPTTSQQGFQESFRSEGYMHIKNSILVLTKIAPYFPLDYSHGQHITHSVEELISAETREDLKILAQG